MNKEGGLTLAGAIKEVSTGEETLELSLERAKGAVKEIMTITCWARTTCEKGSEGPRGP